MICRICHADKLSKEFIPYSATKECDHPPLICLRCITKHAREKKKCPYEGCGANLEIDMDSIMEFQDMLHVMFDQFREEADGVADAVDRTSEYDSTVCVVGLTGKQQYFFFEPNKTVKRLQREIAEKFDENPNKLELLYKDKELKEYIAGKEARLCDFDVQPGAVIYLLIVLYKLPSRLTAVTFDLSWNYPASKKDYLDASCLVYNKTQLSRIVDFRRTYMAPESEVTYLRTGEARGQQCFEVHVLPEHMSIQHSGDYQMDDQARTGRHKIDVYLKRLPQEVTHLFFILSAWEHPTISHFPNPSLSFYEISTPNTNLCQTKFKHAKHSSAVIMCSLRRQNEEWKIVRSGTLSAGNANNYKPLETVIEQLINEGKC